MKILLEVVAQSDVKAIQKKINQWQTAGTLRKFETVALADGNILFKIATGPAKAKK